MSAHHSSPIGRIVGIGFFLLAFGFCMWVYAPGVIRDASAVRAQTVPALGMRLTKASCKSAVMVVSFCSVSYKSSVAAPNAYLNYLVLGTFGGERVQLMRRVDTGEVITDFAVTQYAKRLYGLGIVGVLLLGLAFVLMMRRAPGSANGEATYRQVPAQPTASQPATAGYAPSSNRPGGLPSHSSMPQRVPRTFGQRSG